MQRRIDDDIHLGKTVTPFESIGESRVIYRTASIFDNANEKVQKIKRLIKTGEYYEDVASPSASTFPQPFTWFRLCRSLKDNVPG